MFRKIVNRKRVIAGAMSAMLVASAFQPGGCNLQIDQGLLQSLLGSFSGPGGPAFGGVEGSVEWEGQFHGGTCDGDHDGPDGWDDDGPAGV